MSYSVGYYAAWVVAVIGVIAGVLAGASQTPWHPSWLTNDIAATAGIASAICVGLAAILPQVGRTPAKREQEFMSARRFGTLPDDLAQKHAASLTPVDLPPPH